LFEGQVAQTAVCTLPAGVTFNSLDYAIFFPAVLLVYWRLSHRGQNLLLLVASYFFYGLFDWRFLGLLWLSTATDFTIGRLLDHAEGDRRRRAIFAASLMINLGVLGVFKYFNFFSTSAHRVLTSLGVEYLEPTLHVLLPVGISFYTFHGISYTFDVYRRHIEPTKSILSFAVFVAFFPQLVAGPIGRAQLQLPQFERERTRPTWTQVRTGAFLILLGLFRKVAIADAVAPFVSRAFEDPETLGWIDLGVGVVAFALQIYGDFCGYTDIARGSARLLGVELPLNFRQPYLSRNITEFWRNWHISLSNWLRDYLYVPLGGNRGSEWTTYRNLMITMLLGGLWHGAAWTFVIWGGLHGLYLAAHRRYRPDVGASRLRSGLRDVASMAGTFALVCFAWVFFRSPSLDHALRYLKGLATFRTGEVHVEAIAVVLPALVIVVLLDLLQRRSDEEDFVLRRPIAARGVLYGLMAVGVLVFSGGTPVPFIYFQF
jgi:alginate O-acetyltransferase complex protein AlgI